ncbi:MAG: hypothetical protein NFW16_10735 [Candidatus Accumulibacter sp.]|uniref:hypothetical protein n=1 Tax=Accumulibacter sp. TaxID=2053492 RepID=UPI00258275D7|nr:hypothetical protein [Accumulibacter sp.]MCM8622184.1 hypothetical protein [Accumulibacter sp.]
MRHELAHPEPWIIVRDGVPNRVVVRDYGARWSIESMFSDFKSRGVFVSRTSTSNRPKRFDCLILIMTLATY